MLKMQHMGARLSILNEFLQSVKLVKSHALEEDFRSRMRALRSKEESAIYGVRACVACQFPICSSIPMVTNILVFGCTYAISGGLPSPPLLFAFVALLKITILPLSFLGNVLGVLAMISTSCARLRKLLLARKLQSRSPKPQEEGSNGAPQPSSAEAGSVDGLSSPAAKPADHVVELSDNRLRH